MCVCEWFTGYWNTPSFTTARACRLYLSNKIWVVTNYVAVKSKSGETPTETWCCLWTLQFWLNKLCAGAAQYRAVTKGRFVSQQSYFIKNPQHFHKVLIQKQKEELHWTWLLTWQWEWSYCIQNWICRSVLLLAELHTAVTLGERGTLQRSESCWLPETETLNKTLKSVGFQVSKRLKYNF